MVPATALSNGELPESDRGLAALPDAGSTMMTCLRRVKVSLRSDTDNSRCRGGSEAVEDNSLEGLLAREPGMVMERERAQVGAARVSAGTGARKCGTERYAPGAVAFFGDQGVERAGRCYSPRPIGGSASTDSTDMS